MTVAPGFVLLSEQDQDALGVPAIATVSKEDEWDDGGFSLGYTAAAQGALWVDRAYWTGNPDPAWLAERCRRAIDAGGYAQCGNELNLELEGFYGGPDTYFALEDAVREHLGDLADRLLAMPPSPGVPDWTRWVRRQGDHAAHCYGSFEQMRQVGQWYLDNTDGRVYITELNFGAGNVVDVEAWAQIDLVQLLDWAAARDRIKMAAYFAWQWNESASLPTSIDAAGTAIERVTREWAPPASGAAEPPPFSIAATRDQLWTIAGHLEENGWDWYGQGIKALTSLSKGER